MIDAADLQAKWNYSWEAHQDEVTKYTLIDQWFTAFEKHLRTGEDWDDAFRFPELFGAVQRKYDELVDFWPSMKARGDGDEVISLQSAYDHQVRISNLEREKNRAGMDAVKCGLGWTFVAPVRYTKKTKEGEKLFYDGLGAERVDPRDIIPAYSALVVHDHTGQAYCPYLFRRRVFYIDTFRQKYSNSKFNQEVVKKITPTSYDGAFSGDRTMTQREGREKQAAQFVVVLEYWNQETDDLIVFANGFENVVYESPVGIPYSHKQLPFHPYYDYRRQDSIYGLGEIELNMPYNLFRETVLNLMIDNAKLELQPAYIVAGDVNFNTEEQELEPGAIFTLRGPGVGKVQDSIMPFRAGAIGGDIPFVMDTIENSRITTTGDDTRSLYENPNQLATQTLAKREKLQKRIKGNIIRNAIESEFYLANQICSYLKNELAKPYKDGDNKTIYRKISINGYEALQDKKESKAEFKKAYGAKSEFYLNAEIADGFNRTEIEIITDKLDEQIKRDRVQSLMIFMQEIMRTAQINPEILKDMDVSEFLKDISQNLNLDVGKIFPPLGTAKDQLDIINTEHEQISMGVAPEIKEYEDSMEHYMKHVEFEKSSLFKKLSKKAHDAMKEHKLNTLKNVQIQKTNAGTDREGGMAGAPQIGQQAPVQGMGGAGGGQAASGRAVRPEVPEASFKNQLRGRAFGGEDRGA